MEFKRGAEGQQGGNFFRTGCKVILIWQGLQLAPDEFEARF